MKALNFILVGAGGALGSMLRYGVTLLFAALGWSGNLATMAVNIIGSFAIGLLSGSVQNSAWLLLLTVGLCGGFTTFSTFSIQSVRLIQEGRIWAGLSYILLSVIICVLMAAAGYWLGKKLV